MIADAASSGPSEPPPISGARQFIFWAVGFLVFIALLVVLRAVLLPFVAGAAIAYLLDPIADWIEGKGVPRIWATLAIIFVALLGFVAAIVLLVPLVHGQIVAFAGNLPEYTERARQILDTILAALRDRLPAEAMERLREGMGGLAGRTVEGIGNLAGRLIGGGLAFLNLVSLLFITPIVAFYLILDWDRLVRSIDDLLPRDHASVIREQVKKIDAKLAGFVRGQTMVAAIQGVFYAVALTLAGLDFGIVIGLGAGFASFIPYVGSIAGLVVSVGMAVLQFGDIVPIAIVAAIFFVGQIIEGNFLTPKLVGGQVGLHPVWMIFALLAGGALLGILGLLLAVPAAAAISVIVAFAIERYRASRLFLGHGKTVADSADPPE
ncbi:MAG: AI-2E family transporter [Alphaproteobacteria bacterium]|nr:AI-2E family transporter [Alphaproteobacteria bacterium]